VAEERRVPIRVDADIVSARQEGRELASELGFTPGDLTVIATAISEVARNIIEYANQGEILLSLMLDGDRRGIRVVARDEGPGIKDVGLALQDGYSTGNRWGLGLPGARRLMDEFEIVSSLGQGTEVIMKKWTR
jgi:serine/threonine-protein kinase RsbT